MTQLTEEKFRQILTGELQGVEQRIVKRIDEAQEELARMVATGFESLEDRLDVTEQMRAFQRKFEKLEEALHIKL